MSRGPHALLLAGALTALAGSEARAQASPAPVAPAAVSWSTADGPVLSISAADLTHWPDLQLRLQFGGKNTLGLHGLIASDIQARLGERSATVSRLARVGTPSPMAFTVAAAGTDQEVLQRAVVEVLGRAAARLSDGDTIHVLLATDSVRRSNLILSAGRLAVDKRELRSAPVDSIRGSMATLLSAVARAPAPVLLVVGHDSLCARACRRRAATPAVTAAVAALFATDNAAAPLANALGAALKRAPDVDLDQVLVELVTTQRSNAPVAYEATVRVDGKPDGAPRELQLTTLRVPRAATKAVRTTSLPILSTTSGGGAAQTRRALSVGGDQLLLIGAGAVLVVLIVLTMAVFVRRRRRSGRRSARPPVA